MRETSRRLVSVSAVSFDLNDALLERALRSVLDEMPPEERGGAVQVTVSDDPEKAAVGGTVVVARARPADCARVLQGFLDGTVLGACCSDEPEQLAPVLAAVAAGVGAVTPRLLELARVVPSLSARQITVLAGLAAGSSNQQISRAVQLSEATVKREVAAIRRAMDATSRVGIVNAAFRLGFGS